MKKLLLLATLIYFNTVIVSAQSTKAIIPLGGNAWAKGAAIVTDEGLTNWKSPQDITSIYFRVSTPQTIKLALRLRVPKGNSAISISSGKMVFIKKLSNAAFDTVSMGNLSILKPGYVKLNLKGISKTGSVYADVTDLIVDGVNADNQLTYVKPGSSFHFGRRGPSVHLRYGIPDSIKNQVKWFYNEITVPQKMDVVGSYFMADGFNGGYFGMQVNSATERRVLFSVWSPFTTDDPKSIPDSLLIKLLSKGPTVHGGEFGDEGSGGQSYLQYPWQAGKTYAFLLEAEPNATKNATTYTAWFKEKSSNTWLLIASFLRPKTNRYLNDLYSFVENFEPDNGDKTRMAYFTNQWLGNTQAHFYATGNVTYTGDETARKNYRKDYSGGVKDGKLYLRNCGFFDDLVPLNQKFSPKNGFNPPLIDFKTLPR
ncbi:MULTISPECIES: DUF3472 domain-containing protein [unclassified Mucilaginibacter]|uniref:DUF3472 domain-containing protein n=1 Tax=unclassified Mucilaginibacter TaxID=2617802 RepID=UPI002AC9B4F3|nr:MULTISPECIES: DUF3472 domain-containing protein [unclassified Mucilaginibacter]MEB0263354.1 DUF3472 domain-containing protein [Mucilaginibacter sp. 10I4]MEB0279688.1 DUF3472 domain-containing protein [Mucilaginibacter sp. 10B2]MEB0302534.1 DUF3472 domain-containing protein [Mucilaginibacter sp. 5C4]WPX23752.1 DUF3472 domain-containing protein [Mucilaginibacter sp. 5C4]